MTTESPESATIAVSEALALPELAAGAPEVLVGAEHLDRRLRWAHVVAGTGAAPLLDGGELLLTTGAGWPTEPEALAELARGLVATNPAAFVFELGDTFPEAPAPLRRACEAAGVPLVALHREVRFVQITQRIHQRLLAAQSEALVARSEVHAMLTELGLNRSPVDYVVERLSETIGAPVVLEDSAGNVVAWSGASGSSGTSDEAAGGDGSGAGVGTAGSLALSAWVSDGREDPPAPGWDRVAVEAQGRRWGALTALPGPPHPAGRRTVLELGAFALALGRLADPDGTQWLRLSSKHLFDVLLGGRFRRDEELAVQLSAYGLPIEGRVVLGAVLSSRGEFGAHESLERAILETALRRTVAPEGRVILAPEQTLDVEREPGRAPALLALLSFPAGDARVSQPGSPDIAHPLAVRLSRELDMLLPSTTPPGWRAHLSLGAAGHGLRSLITSLERVRAAGTLRPVAGVGRVTVQQAERQALAYLVRGLSATPEMQEFVSATLAPLVEHDEGAGPGHSGDLLRVLSTYLAHPTNRSLAAQRARLSRSVFYQRLALIEELLGVDLTDGDVIATLAVALLARRPTD